MNIDLKVGDKVELTKVVKSEDSAATHGSGLVEVFATPAMVAFMEKTALEVALKGLEEGFGTVGTHISTSHSKATPIGMTVWCEAELTEVDGRRLVYSIRAWDEDGEIGKGTHERFVINNEKFMAKLNK